MPPSPPSGPRQGRKLRVTGRRLRRGENRLGLEGLALLRLRHAEDASAADEILAEMRMLLGALGNEENRMEHHYPILDAAIGYGRWAEVYDSADNPVVAHEGPAMQEILNRLPGEPVLDAACGTGRHLVFLSERGRTTIGVDQSDAMLGKARAKVPTADLRRGDLEALPLDDGSVAGVVCSLALDHIANLDRAFAEFRRVLAPGGWAAVSVMHPVMRNIVGWSAWFADDDGRAEVVSYHPNVSDYLNAALTAKLELAEAHEIPIADDAAAGMIAPAVPVGAKIALAGLPLILLLRFTRR